MERQTVLQAHTQTFGKEGWGVNFRYFSKENLKKIWFWSQTEGGKLSLKWQTAYFWNEPSHEKTNKVACVPIEGSDQPGHLPSLIRVFAVHSMGSYGPKLSSCGQRRLWSDWVNAQADLSLRWTHMPLCCFCHEVAQIICPARVVWSHPQQPLCIRACGDPDQTSGASWSQPTLLA